MDVAAVDVEPQPASHSQPSGKPTARSTASATPVSPAAIGGIVGIGLGIVILVFAILSLWRRQSATETASNSGGTIASAAGKDPHPSVPPPAQSEKPTPPPEQPSPAPENPFDPGSPESPVTPPSTDPPPKNPPPKNPKPPVSPPTPPMPAPPAAPTPEQTEKVRAILLRARQSLADRDPAAATAAVKEAEQLAGEGPLQDAIAPTADLAHYVGEFWRAVHAALPKLGGSEIELGDTVVYVVEAGPDRLVIRMAGQNREYTPQKLPSGLARRIAENWLDKSAATKVIIGAFLAVDPTMQQSSGKEKARGLWKEAARQGADVKELLRVLDEPDK
jgi:hypothetical protein